MAEVDLTPSQRELAIHLLQTSATSDTKVTRRKDLGNGNFELYEVTRPVKHVEFREHPEEFALTAHRSDITQPLSEIYLNLRNMSEETLLKVGKGIADSIPAQEIGRAFGVGIPDAGTAIGHSAAYAAGMTELSLFLKAPTDSPVRLLPNPDVLGTGVRVILFDDLITQATTKLDAIKVAEDMGFVIAGIAVLVDREQGGREQLEERGYKLYAAMKLSSMLNLYLLEGLITHDRFDRVNSYLSTFK